MNNILQELDKLFEFDEEGLRRANELFDKHKKDIDMVRYIVKELKDKILGPDDQWENLTIGQERNRIGRLRKAIKREKTIHGIPWIDNLTKAGFDVKWDDVRLEYDISLPPVK